MDVCPSSPCARSRRWATRRQASLDRFCLRTIPGALLVLASALSAAPACGDCDLDGGATILDALLAARIGSGLAAAPAATAPGFAACNVAGAATGDPAAAIGALDALVIARFVVGLEPALSCGGGAGSGGCPPAAAAPRLLDVVVDYSPGSIISAATSDPARAVDGVQGGGCSAGSTDVASLGAESSGWGGSITLRIAGRAIDNGPGDDLVVYENAFRLGGCGATTGFHETGVVEVSEDGVSYVPFPVVFDPGYPGSDRRRFAAGFCGIEPVLLRTDLGHTPGDPAGGGDRFDLDDVGLCRVRFVRIHDTGTVYPDERVLPGDCDIDGVAALYTSPDP